MSKESEIICIMCPMGCRVTVTTDDKDNISSVKNYSCKEGEKYAIAECKFPGRILTTTLLTDDNPPKLLPVRTNNPIPKNKLMEVMYFLSDIRIKPPVKIGQIVLKNVLNTGVDLISTYNMEG